MDVKNIIDVIQYNKESQFNQPLYNKLIELEQNLKILLKYNIQSKHLSSFSASEMATILELVNIIKTKTK